MRVCVMIEGQEDVSWADWRALAEATERLGFEGLFTSDHYGATVADEQRGAFDAWAVLVGLAALTGRIRLGTMVSPTTFRPAAVLAKLANAVDHISAGRVEVGLGAGWNEGEHRMFGFPFPPIGDRMTMLEEQATALRRLFDGETVTVDGASVRLESCRLLPPPVQARVPIVMGGSALKRGARLAARVADEYGVVFAPPAEVRAARERLDAACVAEGRDPATLSLNLMTRCVVGTDDAEVARRLARVAERSGEDVVNATAEERAGWVVGTPVQAAAQIRAFADAGVDRILLQHLDHTDLAMLELIAAEVVPLL